MMRRPTTSVVLLALCFSTFRSLAYAQSDSASEDRAKPAAKSATEAEVEQLRHEVAELRAIVLKLVEVRGQQSPGEPRLVLTKASIVDPKGSERKVLQEPRTDLAAAQPDTGSGSHFVGAVTSDPEARPVVTSDESLAEPFGFLQADKKDEKPAAAPVSAGWNGEHFFVKSADGQFQMQPYGYVQTDYRSFSGDGTPPDTFTIRRGRFGFQGNYGSHFSFGVLADAAAGSGAIIRDIYLSVKVKPEFQIQGGQFKEPFAQELLTSATNLDFVERGLQSLLYPSVASSYRSPGAAIFGDFSGGVAQYWIGAFNAKGSNVTNTTNVPEGIGRVRFYPWRKKQDSFLQGFAFGGAISYSRTRGLSNELTPSATLPDTAYAFFPQFRINGNAWRYNGELTFIKGPWALRGEYVQAFFDRTGVGTLQLGGLGFGDLPVVRYKAWDISGTYLLTGEKRPENGTPRVKHPWFGPETPGVGGHGWGAWELALRYSGIQGNEPGIFFNNVFTPQKVPTFNQHTQEFTGGLNWYLNYWVKYQINFNADRLLQPSTIGATPQTYFVVLHRLQYRF